MMEFSKIKTTRPACCGEKCKMTHSIVEKNKHQITFQCTVCYRAEMARGAGFNNAHDKALQEFKKGGRDG